MSANNCNDLQFIVAPMKGAFIELNPGFETPDGKKFVALVATNTSSEQQGRSPWEDECDVPAKFVIQKIRKPSDKDSSFNSQSEKFNIKIFPNPNSQEATVSIYSSTDIKPLSVLYSIYSLKGNLMKQYQTDLLNFSFPVYGFNNGSYLIKANISYQKNGINKLSSLSDFFHIIK